MLDLLYSQLARARRRYYQHRPHLRRRLAAPVISIGNLTVGGSSKTPLAAEIARMLIEMGERPSILSRGYARTIVEEGVVVVSDGARVLATVDRSGDEPQMLAQKVPGAAVLVASSRYVAGRLAEARFGCTVHVLDDGFQHFDLMRDIDLLVAPDGSEGARTLPFGRLREPLDVSSAADAVMVDEEMRSAGLPTVAKAFTFSRRLNGPQPDGPAFAFAGIARPERFFTDLERAGWTLTGRRAFRDHHHYSVRELEAIAQAAAAGGAAVILTTEKDLARLGALLGSDPRTGTRVRPQIVAVPLELTIEPSFQPWLAERLLAVRPDRSA